MPKEKSIMTIEFELVIGLEVHAQLKTKTKIFCGCSTEFGALPNTNVCPVCLGMPGVLPVLNKKVVEYAMLMGFATNCKILNRSRFARKNYFYPDLPKGYQVSQYEFPICSSGYIEVEIDGIIKKIGITRIHMEEDAGKLIHDNIESCSKVDLNRTGVPLIEIVSEPDISSYEEADAYLKKLRSILRYLDICDGNMEEGSFRCDANISIRPKGEKILGTRTEIKNLNSFKHIEKALAYEADRQEDLILRREKIIQETRLWNPDKNITTSMRGKEEAHDYRYFPDPDLVPLVIDEAWKQKIKNLLPELPDDKKKRFISSYNFSEYDADFLTSEKDIADYFETCAKLVKKPENAAKWIMGTLSALLNSEKKDIKDSQVSAQSLAELIKLIENKTISEKIAKTVFLEMAATKKSAKKIVEEKGLIQISDESELEKMASEILSQNPKEAEAYKNGKTKLMGFFVGEIMKKTKGRANPKLANEILTKLLKS
jgi:aspartyl-tRNA(Asn)/glutamyl-tRNA(Gln) amidotransferase subunit B